MTTREFPILSPDKLQIEQFKDWLRVRDFAAAAGDTIGLEEALGAIRAVAAKHTDGPESGDVDDGNTFAVRRARGLLLFDVGRPAVLHGISPIGSLTIAVKAAEAPALVAWLAALLGSPGRNLVAHVIRALEADE